MTVCAYHLVIFFSNFAVYACFKGGASSVNSKKSTLSELAMPAYNVFVKYPSLQKCSMTCLAVNGISNVLISSIETSDVVSNPVISILATLLVT